MVKLVEVNCQIEFKRQYASNGLSSFVSSSSSSSSVTSTSTKRALISVCEELLDYDNAISSISLRWFDTVRWVTERSNVMDQQSERFLFLRP